MDGVTLVSHDSMNADPIVQDLRSELDAAWEEHAAKRSRKISPEKPQAKNKPTGSIFQVTPVYFKGVALIHNCNRWSLGFSWKRSSFRRYTVEVCTLSLQIRQCQLPLCQKAKHYMKCSTDKSKELLL